MTKKVKIAIIAGVTTVALAGYFLIVPTVQATNYTKDVKAKHSQLSEDVDAVSKTLDSESFVKTEVETSQIQSDIKAGRDAITEAEHTLAQAEKDLTGFKTLPLLGWNSKYRAAKKLNADEQKYIADTRVYIAELKATIDTLEQGIEVLNGLEEYTQQITLISQKAGTIPEYGAMMEAPLKKAEDAINKYATIKPAASVKELHDYGVTSSREYIELQKQAIAAAKANDEEKLMELALKEQEKMNEITVKTEELNGKFIKDSSLRKMTDDLKALNRTINDQLN